MLNERAMTTHDDVRPLSAPAPGILLITIITCLSGFAGLGYEIAWTRLLANSFGHEIVAVLGVLAALFGGLALGSLFAARRISANARPELWYAGLELVIGLWALVLIPLLPALGDLVPLLTPVDATPPRQWAVAFALPFLVLLPATLAMGATLPALESILAPRVQTGGAVGWVYASNTLGAVVGTLTTTFWIIPVFGLSRTLGMLALVNFACATAMIVVSRAAGANETFRVTPRPQPLSAQHQIRHPHILISLFLTGLLGIGYEVLAVRTLGQIMENTVYTFAALLSVYLFGTAAGAFLRARFPRDSGARPIATWLSCTVALSCVIGIIALGQVDVARSILRGLLPSSVPGAIAVELGVAATVFLAPTVAMGALFAHLAQIASDRDGGVGLAFAANTAGAALAPILFGPILMPLLGAKLALVLIAVGYVLAVPSWRWTALAPSAAVAALALAPLMTPLSLRFVEIPPGGTMLWHRDGIMAAVSVVRDRAGDHHLAVNNRFRMGGTASVRSDYREADIPLLLHPAPGRALFLGLGTGATISAAGDHPGLAVEGVELVPEVVDAFPWFAKAAPNIARNPNISIHSADARRYVRAASGRYDVVVADVYHPWIDGTGTLYTREHFAAIRALLAEDGLFCQWLPLHQLDLPTLRLIVRTFLAEFPDASAYLAQFSIGTPLVALVGSRMPKTYPADWLARRVSDPKLRARLSAVDLTDEMALFGLYLAGAGQLAAFAGTGPVNTDDRPVVTFEAPRVAYVTTDSPGERLVALLSELHPRPDAVLAQPAGKAPDRNDTARRLTDYWRARDRFLELGVRMRESSSIRDVVAELAPRLIEVVRISADFDAAYRPVLAMAKQLAATDPAGARRLLEELDRANPARPDARRQLMTLPPP